MKRDENPMLWWKNHINEYPKFKHFILKYLCAPPNSSSSERMSSSARQINTGNRNRLDPANAEQLLFIMRNMKVSKISI